MLPLRYAQTWLMAGLALLAVGLVAALSPMPALAVVKVSDKTIHALVFLAFMVWFAGVFTARLHPSLVVALSAYGLLIELLQTLTRSRQGDVLDLIADVVGILVGWVLSAAGLSRWCATLESWFVRPSP